MLQTLIQIGQQLSQSRSEWDDIIDVPDLIVEREKGIRLLVAEMLFDLDNNEIILGTDSLQEYREDAPFRFKNIRIQGGNNKAIYSCVYAPKSLEQIRKTFFSTVDKAGKLPEKGQFSEAIEKDFSTLSTSPLNQALKAIFILREKFEEGFVDKEKNVFLPKALSEKLSLGKSDMLVLLYTSVKSAALGVLSPTPVAELAGYETFIRNKFLNRSAKNSTGQKLCYATGKVGEKVDEVAFNTRYSLNKMFVTTTRNYASRFDTNNFRSNYQVSEEAQKLLERGSSYILENHTIPIAGVNHCIIPQVFSQSTVDASAILAKLSRRSDLLFKYQELKDFSTQIDDTEPDIYWIDFLGYESDGNFFKTIHYIKDVSKTHFTRLLKTFQLVHRELKEVNGIQWDEVMSAGKNHSLSFNLFTFYGLIPLRKDKEKKNEALTLFKAILEQRKISSQKLFEHYRELILCHRFERYRSYTNVYANNEFDFAVRNATYQYLAIFQVLTRLNLLKNMEEKISTSEIDIPAGEFYQQQVELFFTKMAYSDAQKALFYLGRTLNAVAYAQVKKEHASKPILEKVNFNGLDNRAIMRLRNDLMEKTKQYRIYDKTEFLLSQFTQYYNPNEKKISPEEALFFLLSGYSFRLKSNA